DEATRIGRFIVDKLNRMEGPLRFLIPEGGLSGLDQPGGPFWDPAADRALFDVIASNFRAATNRRLLKIAHHINDQAFADALVAMAHEVLPVVQHTPVLAGVNGTDPFLLVDPFLRRLGELGFSGIQNFPTVGLFDGVIRAQLEETGMGYALEVQLVEQARKLDLLTTPYVFS